MHRLEEELKTYDLRFFAVDKRKFARARKGMPDALKMRLRNARKMHLVSKARNDFKAFLKKKFATGRDAAT